MANWQRHIYLQPEWGQAQELEISIQHLARVVASRLKEIKPFGLDTLDGEREELIADFESIACDVDGSDTDDFDAVMCRLYDWGDTSLGGGWNGKKACWIDCISARAPAPTGD